MFKTLIIDDESDAIEILVSELQRVFDNELQIIGQSTRFEEGVLLAKEYQPDLIFLDINLGNGKSGFDVAAKIQEMDFPTRIIFTTAYHQFAIKAIKIEAYDYLLKPIGEDDLVHLKERLNEVKQTQKPVLKDGLVVNTADALYKIAFEDILYFKGDGNYTSIYLVNKSKPILSSNTLNHFEKEINTLSSSFFRTHKSFLVNLGHIEYVKKTGVSRSIIMKSGDVIQISRLRYKAFSSVYF